MSTSCLLAVSLLAALACGPAANARELQRPDLSLHQAAPNTSTSDTILEAIKELNQQSAYLECAWITGHPVQLTIDTFVTTPQAVLVSSDAAVQLPQRLLYESGSR
jgi:uncharacterized protein YueI